MALASFERSRSVVALSESPVFHHQYSSITDAISHLACDERDVKRVRRLFQAQWLRYFPVREVNHWQTDVVNVFREYAPCLADRQYRHKANQVIGSNKPIGIGYGLSLVNLADFSSRWSLPFELQRVKSSEDEILLGARQIKALCQREEFADGLNINAADSQYGVAKYISQVAEIENLVSVIRLRHGKKVYQGEAKQSGGAPQIYGEKFYLIEHSDEKIYKKKSGNYRVCRKSIYTKPASEKAEISRPTRKGKQLRVELRRWRQMKMRTRKGARMKQVEFDVVGIRVLEQETDKRVFRRDVFVAVVGEQRRQMSLEEVAEVFYRRFDLEVTNRLMKQQLFLQSYQTPAVRHLDNWLLIVQEAMWLLWAASEEVEEVCEKWQKYSEPKREKGERKTAAQTRKGLERLFLTFEQEAFRPKKCKKGVGRKKGTKQEPRKQYRVVKKWQEGVELIKASPP